MKFDPHITTKLQWIYNYEFDYFLKFLTQFIKQRLENNAHLNFTNLSNGIDDFKHITIVTSNETFSFNFDLFCDWYAHISIYDNEIFIIEDDSFLEYKIKFAYWINENWKNIWKEMEPYYIAKQLNII